ncbi:non-ribosomal peptide synthetase [Nocardioides speluncae]|uniref:non-ribosomal peptide synthetase n=1 Tax=Nocardioides speluncae TaxID=2670337 RepID=UPI000D694D47|nr:non-ribosomal peptide synthetase [Nocardioides speluncae]
MTTTTTTPATGSTGSTDSTSRTPARPVDAYPMTSLQAGMLYHSSLHTRSATYHDQVTLELSGHLDEQALRAAAADVVAAHAVLRTSFDLQRFSEPMQLVWDHVEVPIEVVDLAGRDLVVARAGIRRRLEEERTVGFDWSRPPLLRILAYRLPRAANTSVTLTFHHAILDGWSLSLLLDELMRRYRAAGGGERLDLPAPRGSFREVVALERQAEANPESQAYWREAMHDAPLCRFPRHATAEKVEEVAAVRESLPADVVEGLTELARAASVPLRTVFLAVHLRLVALWSGTREAVSGVVTHNRTEIEDCDRILGLFLAALPLRVDVSLDDSWRALVQRVFRAELDLMPHRGVPLATIQRWVERGELYDVLFDFRSFGTYYDSDEGLPSLGVDEVEGFEQTNLPLAVNVIGAGNDVVLEARYDSAQFLPEEIEALLATYRAALRHCAITPDADPRPTTHLGVVGGVSVGGGGVVDVGGLGEVVGRVWEPVRAGLAGRLRGAGVGPAGAGSGECVVGVLMERGPGLVEAVHAVVGAGGVYLPLEPDFPDDHLGFLLADAGCTTLVTEPGLESRVRNLVEQRCPDAAVVVHAAGEVPGDAEPVSEPVVEPVSVDGEELAYVIHTSGSTGRPKGVGVSHRAVANRLWWMRDLVGITADDRVLLKTPFSFDVSVWELFLPAYVGAVQVVAGAGVHRDSAALVELVAAERVSVVHFVPSMLDAFLAEPALTAATEQERSARWGELRVVVCSGEALTPALVARAGELLPWVEVINLYGPTEAAVDVTWHRVRAGESPVPIGVAVPHTRIEVLDEGLQRVPVGVAGELCIAGVQVARGYVGRPGLTARSFVPDPYGTTGARMYRTGDRARITSVGTVEFLGRSDGQVKVRGVRVELGEVRAGLERDPWVRAAWVTHAAGADGGSLTGYLVPESGADSAARSPQVWRDHLAERMPAHMVPTRIVELTELPVTVNGKLDTTALAQLESSTVVEGVSEGGPPRTPTEVAVAQVWSDLLDPGRPLSVTDNFFDLGGHSILALRMAASLRTRLEVEVPIAILLSAPTVGQFAAELDRGSEGTREDRIVALRRTGDRPPMIFMHALGGQIFRYEPVAKHLGEDQPVWAIPAAGLTKGVAPQTDLDTMAREYAELIREAVPSTAYVLGGFCIGGNIAMEVARHLTAAGATVHAVLPVWSSIDEPVARASLEDDVVMMNHALAGGFADVEPADLIGLSPEEQLLAVVKGAAENNALQVTSTDVDEVRSYLDVFRANAHAVGHYQHASWAGRVVLFLPKDDEYIDLGDDQGWSGVAPDTTVQAIPGSRHTAVQEPHAIALAALMRQRIDEAMRLTAEPSDEENQ